MLSRQGGGEVHDILRIILQGVLGSDIPGNTKAPGIFLHPGHIHVLPGPAFPYQGHIQDTPQDCFNCGMILHLFY